MLFLYPSIYTSASSWFVHNASSNESLLVVFMMWFSTEMTYFMIFVFFLVTEKSAMFMDYKIHKKPLTVKYYKIQSFFPNQLHG